MFTDHKKLVVRLQELMFCGWIMRSHVRICDTEIHTDCSKNASVCSFKQSLRTPELIKLFSINAKTIFHTTSCNVLHFTQCSTITHRQSDTHTHTHTHSQAMNDVVYKSNVLFSC